MKSENTTERANEIRREQTENIRLVRERGLFAYLFHTLRSTSFWILSRRLVDWFRRFRLIALLFRVLSFLWGILQTGALVILSTVLFLIALPLLLSFMIGVLITALLETKKSNERLFSVTEGKRIYVLFLSRTPGAFFRKNAENLAKDKNAAVIAVSPYWLSSKGLKKGHFYCTVRREAESLYLVRRFYFFSLRRRVLAKRKTAYLY